VAQILSNALARLDAERALRGSEERFRGLVENATVGIYRTTPDGRILAANPTLIRMLGYADFETLAERNLEAEGFEPTYTRTEFRERIEKEGQVIGLEAAWRKQDGSVIFVRESARAIRGQSCEILYYDGIVEDITERKQAEEALRKAERQYRDIFEGALEGIFRISAEGKALAANPAIARTMGYDSAEEVVSSITDAGHQIWVNPEDRLAYLKLLEEHGIVRGYECVNKRKDGTKVWLSISSRRVCGPDRKTLYYEGFIEDITERKRAEEALRRRAAFDELMTGILSRFATCAPSEVDAAVVKALEAIAEFVGADHAYVLRVSKDRSTWSPTHEWCGANLTPRLQQFQSLPFGTAPWTENMLMAGEAVRINSPNDFPPDALNERRHQEAEGYLAALNVPLLTKDGILGSIGLHSHARPMIWSDDDVVRLRLVGDAVAGALERKQAFEELQKSEEMFSTAFHASPVAMTIVSVATGRYVNVNRAFEEMTGFGAREIIGRTPQDFGRPAAGKEQLRGLETQYRTKSGEVRTWLLSTELIEFGGEACSLRAGEDITERKRIEQSLRELGAHLLVAQESERRRLARELHDDFSQRLALLTIDLEQLVEELAASEPDLKGRIQAMWSQALELTSDIHRLSRQLHPSKLDVLGLVEAVRSYCYELSRQAGIDVKFSAADVPRDLPKEISLCIYRILQEALGNVVKHSGAKTAVVGLGGGPDEVHLVVSDPGKGFAMEDAQASKGLGLVSMRERARYVGGVCSIDAPPSGGARVIVRIPVPSQPALEEIAQTSGAVGFAESWTKDSGRTRVLLADDHTLLVEAFKSLLEPEFEVVGAVADGRAAVAAVEKLKADLVVQDMAMRLLN
jgi:PAS domain S-box-containing protein